MGADFIRKTGKSFEKCWDRHRVTAATADLFTKEPTYAARTAQADVIGDAILECGDVLVVQIANNELIAMRGLSIVAKFADPPPDLLAGVRSSCGIAKGIIQQVHVISGVVEISLC